MNVEVLEGVMWLTFRELRESRGLTVTQLGAMVGLGAETIRGYEKGRRLPNPVVALRMAKALEVTVEELYASLGISVDSSPPYTSVHGG